MVRSDDEELLIHTLREFKILMHLNVHPNIVQGYNYFSEPRRGRGFLVMEKVTGKHLLDIIMNEGALPGNNHYYC